MARATLSYTLPEEESDFKAALQGRDAKLCLWNFAMYLRNRVKHGELSPEVRQALQAAREELQSMMNEHGVSLDD